MKIAIVNPEFTMGGAQTACIAVANGLAKYGGHEVFLVDFLGKDPIEHSPDSGIEIIRNVYSRPIFEKASAFIHKIIFQKFGKEYSISKVSASRIGGLVKIIQNQKIERVILSAGYLTALLPTLKLKLPHIKFIVWQHSTYEIYIERYTKAYSKEYLRGIELADAVVCLTKADATQFRKHNLQSCCIYNPLTFQPIGISTLKNNRIIFVGRLEWETKGLEYLVEIMKQVNPRIKLMIIGDGPDRERLEIAFKANNLLSRVEFIGAVKQAEVAKYYVQSDVVISTSKWEGFGLTLVEGMSSGLPAVAFNNQGPLEILNHGEYGIIIEKFDSDKFSEILNELFKEEDIISHYKDASLRRVKEFESLTIVKAWDRLLENLI